MTETMRNPIPVLPLTQRVTLGNKYYMNSQGTRQVKAETCTLGKRLALPLVPRNLWNTSQELSGQKPLAWVTLKVFFSLKI